MKKTCQRASLVKDKIRRKAATNAAAEDANFHERRAVTDQAMNQTHQCLPPKTVLLFIKKASLFVLGLFPAHTQGQGVSEVIFDSSDIPIVIIDTQNQAILDEPRILAKMKIIDNQDGSRNVLASDNFAYDGDIEIEIRGSTSQSYEKKQYRIETQHPDGSNHNVSLMGLPEENDWILGAPTMDKTMIRNALAYHISRALGEYAPRTRPCELVLNGEYRGVYVLTEKPKRDRNRLSLSKDEGYILKIDKFTGYKCAEFLSTEAQGVDIQYDYPDCEVLSQEGHSYIDGYVNRFEKALFSEDFMSGETGYRQFLDTRSFVNHFICTELSKDVDGYRLSTFLHKEDASKKLRFGPVWDKNIAFGNADFLEGHITSDFIANRYERNDRHDLVPNPWVAQLLKDSTLVDEIANRWSTLRAGTLSNENLSAMVDSLAIDVAEAQHRNFQRWPAYLGGVWPNFFVGSSHWEEVAELKAWLINRANWMDNNITGTFISASPPSDLFNPTVYPNPFTHFFTYAFRLQEEAVVSIQVVAPNGSKPGFMLKDQHLQRGSHQITWNSYINSQLVPSSFYVLLLQVNGVVVEKSVVVKRL